MLWDLFCRVIDNFGDIGVCWRLAADLGQRGHEVRLWVDDTRALAWMAPQVQWHADERWGLTTGRGQHGVTVCRWDDAENLKTTSPGLVAGDVVVEAFGCDPPDAFIARMQVRNAQGNAPEWINLEYLSAEDYVERSHGLRSPVWSGVGTGLSKRFFYPGFTKRTGGLLREPGLIAIQQAATQTAAQRRAVLADAGVSAGMGDKAVLIFCYDSAPVAALLDRLAEQAPGTHVLLTPGAATRLGRAWQQRRSGAGSLHLHQLDHLPQPHFDRLLWCCDLAFVRGEDSAVRALWPGKPHVWQIYEQDDGVHAGKLEAFMARWMAAWPGELRASVREWWLAWNGLGPMPEGLPDWQAADAQWSSWSRASRDELLRQEDLTTQLIRFASSSG